MNQKGLATVWTILIIVAIASAAGLGSYYYQASKTQQEVNQAVQEQTAQLSQQVEDLQAQIEESQRADETAETEEVEGTAEDIREVDLNSLIKNLGYSASLGQKVDKYSYLDLTNDGEEEVVFSVYGGGTAGNIAVYIYGYQNSKLSQLLEEKRYTHYRFSISNQVVTIKAINPDSSVNRTRPNADMIYDVKRRYRWDGSQFIRI